MASTPLPFAPALYAARRARLGAMLAADGQRGLVVLPGNPPSPMNYACNVYGFRQDGTFRYYFGHDLPDHVGVIDLDTGAATLYGPEASLDDVVWEGPQPSLTARAEAVAAEASATPGDLGPAVLAAIDADRPVHIVPPYREAVRQRLAALLGTLPDALGGFVSEPLIHAIVGQRSVKSDAEVAEIENALAVANAMHRLAMRNAKPGTAEWETAGWMRGAALAGGGDVAFPIILTARGETLHNHPTAYALRRGDLVLADAGAVAPSGYASDITRTFPATGTFSEPQRMIYEAVLSAQTAALDAIAPGVSFRDVHLIAARRLAQALTALGLMRGDPEEAVDAGAHALFFPHGLGHMMGLDVHDMEALGEDHVGYDDEVTRSDQFGLSALRLGRRLQPGFVLTVEPGCYFIPALVAAWKAEGKHAAFLDYAEIDLYLQMNDGRGFGGVRIEDDVLVTNDGLRVLGPAIPKTVAEVEAVCGEMGGGL
ncbi:MAG: aminopeptidase P family protein [Bacteroidota bacterium]